MHGRRSYDYPKLAKGGFLVGVGMLLVGVLGEFVGHAVLGSLPGWEEQLFFDLEVLGILVGLITPFVFGVFMPLTE